MYYFLEYLAGLPLLARCGEPSQDYRVEPSLFQAWDNWNGEMMAVWEPETCRLEERAQERLGDDEIDRVFEAVSASVGDRLWQSWCAFVQRMSLEEESGHRPPLHKICGKDTSGRFRMWENPLRILSKIIDILEITRYSVSRYP